MKTKIIALFGTALFILSACSSVTTKTPEQVIQNFKKTAKDVKVANFSVDIAMKGMDAEDNIDFNLIADIKLDRSEGVEHKADVGLKISGALNTGEMNLDGNLDLKILTIGEKYYFKLMELESNDPYMQNLEPLVEPYKKKWQHLSSDFVPENIRELQQKDEETLAKEEQLKELFVNTKLFDVVKEFGEESLNGKKVHHYGVRLNKEGVKQYIRKAATINGTELTNAEVEESVEFANSMTNMEIWIGAKDYYLYKGLVDFSVQSIDESVKSNISLAYTANSYNTDLKIEAPADAEEFNPLALLMGMQFPDGLTEGLESTETDEDVEVGEE